MVTYLYALESTLERCKMSSIPSENINQAECWIGVDEAAKFLNVKPATVRDWIKKDKGIPAVKIGKQWKFKISELDEWVKSGKSSL
jgi:excisionase family DNA binding protein